VGKLVDQIKNIA